MRRGLEASRRAAADPGAASAAETVQGLSPEDDDEAWEIPTDPVPAPVSPPPGAFIEASLWRRGGAALVDAGCSLGVTGLAAAVSELLWWRSGGQVSAPVPALAALFFVAGWTHSVVGEGLCGGATLGKRWAALRVVDRRGRKPRVGWVLLRRLALDAVGLGIASLALWLTMVRQYGGLLDAAPVALERGDLAVFCAFAVNLLVLLGLAGRLDPQRRLPHDWLAGLCVAEADSLAVPSPSVPAGASAGGRRVAGPVGAALPVWDAESVGVVRLRPWEGRKAPPDPAGADAALKRRRDRAGSVARVVDGLVDWAGRRGAAASRSAASGPAAAGSAALPSGPPGRRGGGAVARAADALVSWWEGDRDGGSGAAGGRQPG